ncbi:MAG: site-specific DNA-methyltransferase [Abitibacteriaceae bacterium]|nr:site-specific DNA-methyltransferase [Abditibacteriaceae bacterium]
MHRMANAAPDVSERESFAGHRRVASSTSAVQAKCALCGAVRVDSQLGIEPVPDCLAWAHGVRPCSNCYVCRLRSVFRELWRVLRDDGTAWLNLGDSYAQSGGSNAIPPKHNEDERRPLPQAARTLRRSKTLPGLKKKDLVGIPWRVALALQADGWYLRTDIVWAKGNPMPESVTDRPTRAHEYLFLLTKSKRYYYDPAAIAEPIAEVSKRRYSQATLSTQRGGFKQEQYAAGLPGQKARNRRPAHILRALAQRDLPTRNARSVWRINTQPTQLAHFATFPQELPRRCIRAGSSEKGCCPHCGAPWKRIIVKHNYAHDGTTTSLYPPGSNGYRISLMRQAARARGTEHGSTMQTTGWQADCQCPAHEPVPCAVLDPFMGSGTTGIVAIQQRRRFTGVDLNADYVEMARQRLDAALNQAAQ